MKSIYSIRTGKNKNINGFPFDELKGLFYVIFEKLKSDGYFDEYLSSMDWREIELDVLLKTRNKNLWPIEDKIESYSEEDLFDAIADRLLDCTNLSFEEGTPTLQSPEFIMEMLLYFEYIAEYLDEQGISGVLAKLRQEIEESEGLIHYWTDWILNKEDESEKYACLEGLIVALSNCWKIGQTYRFSIIRGEKKHPE